MTAKDAAATLSSYMSQNGISKMTPDTLYSLSQNSNGNTPPEVSQAATFMRQNPNITRTSSSSVFTSRTTMPRMGGLQKPFHAGFAKAASIWAHAASTASGCRRSIIWSSRARKKSSVISLRPLDFSQVFAAIILISGNSHRSKISPSPCRTRDGAVPQGRLHIGLFGFQP
jgi:hypothetical protein